MDKKVYIKRDAFVDAIRYVAGKEKEVLEFLGFEDKAGNRLENSVAIFEPNEETKIWIKSASGDIGVEDSDWIVYIPCVNEYVVNEDEEFHKLYQEYFEK